MENTPILIDEEKLIAEVGYNDHFHDHHDAVVGWLIRL